MKKVWLLAVFVVLVASVSALAASIDGSYKFSSRMKDGTADMSGWQGTMTIKGSEISRTYKSPDGKQEKFYVSNLKQEGNGNVYVLKHTKAYKPEYVGNEFRNKLTLNGNSLTIEAEDGKFKEVWVKK